MTSPSLELQGAIVARLKAAPAVSAIVGVRVYDRVPDNVAFPYVSIGPKAITSDDADCITGFEINIQIDCWSRTVGFPEVERLSDAVRRSLTATEFVLTDNAIVYFEHRLTRIFRDPDGLTNHAALQCEAFAEQP